jgi:hypothetical protein
MCAYMLWPILLECTGHSKQMKMLRDGIIKNKK